MLCPSHNSTDGLTQSLFLKVEVDYTEDTLSISSYPLSGALTCAKICTAFEEVWGVL